MKWSNLTCRDLQRGIAQKLSLEPCNGKRAKHPVYWYIVDGKKVLKVTLPNQHGGANSISTGFLQSIKRELALTTQQFELLVQCPLTADEYEAIVRGLGID